MKTILKRANKIVVGDKIPVAGIDYEILEIHKENDRLKFVVSSRPSKIPVHYWYADPDNRLAILK